MKWIYQCVQRKNKFTLLHKNFCFPKNAVTNFNRISGYTILTLILIIRKSFKKKSRINLSFSSFIFFTLIILKLALEPENSDPESQLRKCFGKYFFSVEVLDTCNRLHYLYYHFQDYYTTISLIKYRNYSRFINCFYYYLVT